MKKFNIKILLIILCALLIASVSYAVTPSDFDGDEWVFFGAGPGQPNEIGQSRGMEVDNYFVIIKNKGNNYVFFWELMTEDHPRYIISDVLVDGKWLNPTLYEWQSEEKPYLKIWPKK